MIYYGGCLTNTMVWLVVSTPPKILVSWDDFSQYMEKTRWAREPKSKTAHSTPFLENLGVWPAVLCTKST